ncbi:hypothetical protein QJQ45_000515 [Haematococcus lacustris]|nr:hypothetical protein QJQ45_000515 [Haematococcus lacustris]
MDDFERAVLISFNFSGTVDAALKERADAFIRDIKQNPEVWRLCIERFSVTGYPEVKFWCLQTLHEYIQLRSALMTWVVRDCNDSQRPLPPFLRNKVAQTLVAVLQVEFPSSWPGFFQDLLRAVLPGSQLLAAGAGGRPSGNLAPCTPGNEGCVDMLCRILISIDDDLVSLEVARSQDESKLSMHVKDAMREHSIADVAGAWYLLVEWYAERAPGLATLVLNTMQRFIAWIDIGLVANDKFVDLLEQILDGNSLSAPSLALRGAAADCLTEIVSKRMEAAVKLNLIQSMAILPRCTAWAAGFAGGGGASGKGSEEQQALLLKLAALLSCLAGEIIDALKKVENGVISLLAAGLAISSEATQDATSVANQASQMLDSLFPALLAAFRSEVDAVALPLLSFMPAYTARLKLLHKRNGELSPGDTSNVRAILAGIAVCGRYPRDSHNSPPLPAASSWGSHQQQQGGGGGGVGSPASESRARGAPETAGRTVPGAAAKEEQIEVEEKRKELWVLFKNLAKVVFPEVLAFVAGLLQAVIASDPSPPSAQQGQGQGSDSSRWQDVEVALALLYELGEVAPEEALKPGTGGLAALVAALAASCSTSSAASGNGHLVQGQGAGSPPSTFPSISTSPDMGSRLHMAVTAATPSAQGQPSSDGAGRGEGVMETNGEVVQVKAQGLQAGQAGQGVIGPLPWAEHRLVALAVMEIFVRFTRLLQQQPGLQQQVVPLYVDGRGMGHPSEDVSTRACYLFCRISKQLRSGLRPHLGALLPSLHPHLAHIATHPLPDAGSGQAGRDSASKAGAPLLAVVDDRLYVFEAVGLLLGQEEVGATEQLAALTTLLQPLVAQIESNLASRGGRPGPASPALIIQALEAVVRLNKGFKTDLATRQRPDIGRLFAQVLEVALAVPREFPSHRLLRARFIACVHRLVEGLQALLLPYLPATLEVLLAGPGAQEAGQLVEVLQLTNQLVVRFKEALSPLMEGLLPVLVARVHGLLDSSWDWSGHMGAPSAGSPGATLQPPGPPQAQVQGAAAGQVAGPLLGVSVSACLEEVRERAELQRCYYGLLHALAHSGLSGALLRGGSAAVLEPVMEALTRGAATHWEPAQRRMCVQVYCRLINEWCSSGNVEAIPGFKRYAMEHLGGEACVLGLLRGQPPLDPRDAATLALLQDLAGALKLVNDKCGDDFAMHLLNVVAPAAGLPTALVQQLVYAVRSLEVKDIRDCLRSILQQAGQAAK